jgi:hypothetical protein
MSVLVKKEEEEEEKVILQPKNFCTICVCILLIDCEFPSKNVNFSRLALTSYLFWNDDDDDDDDGDLTSLKFQTITIWIKIF